MLISRPLKPKENAAAPAKSAAAAPPPVNQAPIRVSPLHFRPKAGNAGDAIPFYWQGEYHVFYLSKEGLEWAHAVSTDLTHWRERPPAVTNPISVRYAWANAPRCNLYNRESLPAVPFRSDDWPMPKKK